MAGGDRMSIAVELAEGRRAVLTTQAAEKLYRSDGRGHRDRGRHRARRRKPARLAAPGADPFRRRAPAAPARCRASPPTAALTLVESVVFGRIAMGEVAREAASSATAGASAATAGWFSPRTCRLEGAIDEPSRARRSARGARALATVLHVAPDAEARRDAAREPPSRTRAANAASAPGTACSLHGSSRPIPQALRADLARFLERFRGTPMPRSWQT